MGFRKIIKNYIDQHTKIIVDDEAHKSFRFPRSVVVAVYLLSLSVLFQGIGDVLLKVFGYIDLLPKLPWRTDFLFLTGISVLMGYQAIIGIRRREMDVTRNSVQLGFIVELALIVGDVEFIVHNYSEIPAVLWLRLPFLVLTTANIFLILFVVKRIKLFWDEDGKFRLF